MTEKHGGGWMSVDDGRTVHVVPVNDLKEHVQGAQCWCRPDVFVECDECDDDADGYADPNCWKCGGEGAMPAPSFIDEGERVAYMHNAADGRPIDEYSDDAD